MSVDASGAIRALSQLPKAVRDRIDAAVRKSGEELIGVAKVLIPVGTDPERDGRERDKITGRQNADGSYLCDFGPKAKVIEGERGPRPFVNPALAVTRKRYGSRVRAAIRRAVREVSRG